VTPETLSSESARFSSPSGHLAEAVGSQSTAACPTAAFGCRRWTTCAGSACRASGDSARSISAVLRRAEPAPETTGLDQALARAGDGAFVIGGDGRILLWNRSAERVLGYAARDVLGRPCCEVFAGYDDDGNRLCYQGCHVMSLVRMDEPIQSFDMRTRTKPGRPVWINVSVLRTPRRHGDQGAAGARPRTAVAPARREPGRRRARGAVSARARCAAAHDRRAQHQRDRRAPPPQWGHRAQPRPEHPRQARRPQPPGSGRVRRPAPALLAGLLGGRAGPGGGVPGRPRRPSALRAESFP
jgi:PAS domain S-box-containing protein